MHKPADRIRNLALVGHRGAGKTSLHEALLFGAGAINRLGSVAEGTTVSDADEDEQARQMSISAALSSFEWQDRKINLLDTPGEPSFVADALGALRVCESAIFVVNAVMGVEVSTERLWQRAQELDIARLIFVNMLDRERADFFRTLSALQEAFGSHVVATEIPIGSEHEVSGVIDLVDMRAYRYEGSERDSCSEIEIPEELADQAQEYHEKLMDEVAGSSDALMERYLEGEEISHAEIVGTLKEGTNHGDLFPVTCGVATRNLATNRLLDAIVEDLPSPVKHGALEVEGTALEADEGAELYAYVFKTRADPFAGRINLFRVYQGTMSPDRQLLNTRTHGKERVGQLLVYEGKETRHVSEFGAGDIGAVAKLKETKAGDWLADRDEPIAMPAIKLPPPVMAFAVEPRSKGDEDKVFTALRRLQEEDPTIDLHRDPQTGEQIVAGLTQVHVEVVIERMRARFGAEVNLKPPRVPYRETIRRGRQGARPPQEADRRAGAVRRLPHRGRADGRGLRVRKRDQGRGDPDRLHPRGGEGGRRGHGARRGRRLPGEGRPRAALRRPVPHGRLLGDGLQARRLAGHEAGARAGRSGAARADHAGHRVGARGERGRRHGRPLLAPGPPAGDRGDRLDDRDPRRGAHGRDAQLRARPALDHRWAGRVHHGAPALTRSFRRTSRRRSSRTLRGRQRRSAPRPVQAGLRSAGARRRRCYLRRPMAERDIRPQNAVLNCDVCGRTLLRGEGVDHYLHAGERKLVCELCRGRAVNEGWIPEGESLGPRAQWSSGEGRRSLLGRLRARRERAGAAAGRDEDGWSGDEGAEPERVRSAPARHAPPPSLVHERHVHAVPASEEMKRARALELFNRSEHRRSVAGIARSLGPPHVAVLADSQRSSVVTIVVAWELSWYRYEADLADEANGVRIAAQGNELAELSEQEHAANAVADAEGQLALAAQG